MDKKQRNRVAEIFDELVELSEVEEAKLSNMPACLEDAPVGQKIQEGIDYLRDATEALGNIIENK